MPAPRYRSRSLKRVYVKLPGGRVTIHYRKKKVDYPKCAICKKPLHGVARGRKSEIKKLSKSERRPERPYGGYLCSRCMREVIKAKVRGEALKIGI